MLPTFHLNNFKPWAPPNRKPLPPQKSPNSCSPSTQNPPRTKIYHNSITSTLPSPKHHLPARPPAEVCVLANAGSQSCLPPSNPRSEPREITAPEPHTYPGILRRGTKAPNDLAAHSSEPDVVSRCNLQENTGISTKPPPFRGDTAEDGLSSPSISSSGNCLEELLRLPDSEDDIPIDPLILADHGSWENMDLQLSIPQVADSLIDSETICPYPDLPPDLCSSTGHFQDRSKRFSGQKDSTRASDHHHIYDNQQVRSSQQNTGPDASYSNGTRENHYISASETPTSAKRKLQQINEGARKRSRVSSMLPLRECSFAALRSHFVSTTRRASAISLLAIRRRSIMLHVRISAHGIQSGRSTGSQLLDRP